MREQTKEQDLDRLLLTAHGWLCQQSSPSSFHRHLLISATQHTTPPLIAHRSNTTIHPNKMQSSLAASTLRATFGTAGNSIGSSSNRSMASKLLLGATRSMASGKEIRFGVEGRAAMLRGVDLLADAVQVRL